MKKTTAILAAVLLLATAAVYAQPGTRGVCDGDGPHGRMFGGQMRGGGFGHGFGSGHGRAGGQMLLALADELELTEAQQQQLQTMMVTFQTERVDAKAKVEKAQIKLRALRMDDEASESAVMAAIDDVSRQRAELQKMQYRHHQQMKGVLTDAQQEKLKQLRQEFRQERRGRFFDDDDDDSPPAPRGRRGKAGR